MDDTDTQVRSAKSVRMMMRDAFETGKASELADFVAGGGVIPSESLVELLRSARIVKTPGGQKGPRDLPKHCAAYIAACCADNYRARSGGPIPRDALIEFAKGALKIVHSHFKLEGSARYGISDILGNEGAHTGAYQRPVHGEACEAVHAKMQTELMALLDWQDAKYFPTLPPHSHGL
jgi:hypothetical protein